MLRQTPLLVVLESRPRWEPELKRALESAELRITACRTAAATLRLLAEARESVLIVDLEWGLAATLRIVEAVHERDLTRAILVVFPATSGELEWPLRELGATSALCETVARQALPALALRICQMSPDSAPASDKRGAAKECRANG